jgi:hypothetical protein
MSAQPVLPDQASVHELLQMKGKRPRQDTEALGDYAGWQSLVPARHE